MLIKCYYKNVSGIRPNRLVFIDAPEKSLLRRIAENTPIIGGPLGVVFDVGGATGDVIVAGADVTKSLGFAISKLAVSFSTLIDLATYGIAKGSVEAIDGFKSLINWIKNHKEMQEPKELDEYGEIIVRFLNSSDEKPDSNPGDSKNVKLFKKLDYDIAILDILLQQVNTFYSPVMREIKKIDHEIAYRERMEYENRPTMVSLKADVDNLNLLINSGHVNAASKAQFTIEMNIKLRNLKQLEQSTDTKNVKWALPQIQDTEFPIGSGRFIKRYIPGEEVNVDLKKVRNQLNTYAASAKPVMQLYVLEKAKHLYRKEALKEKLKIDKEALTPSEEASLVQYNQRLKTAKDGAKQYFDRNLDPSVSPAVAHTNGIEKKDIEKLSYLANNSFSLRKTAVSTPQEHQDYILWKYSGTIPKKLIEFGCSKGNYVFSGISGSYIVKKNTAGSVWKFDIGGDGSVTTGFPDGVVRKLPLNQYPGKKDAWNPPMP